MLISQTMYKVTTRIMENWLAMYTVRTTKQPSCHQGNLWFCHWTLILISFQGVTGDYTCGMLEEKILSYRYNQVGKKKNPVFLECHFWFAEVYKDFILAFYNDKCLSFCCSHYGSCSFYSRMNSKSSLYPLSISFTFKLCLIQ